VRRARRAILPSSPTALTVRFSLDGPADYENEVWEKVSRQDSGSIAGSDYGSQRESARPRARAAANSGYNSPNGGDY
jgi:hypothetical protein